MPPIIYDSLSSNLIRGIDLSVPLPSLIPPFPTPSPHWHIKPCIELVKRAQSVVTRTLSLVKRAQSAGKRTLSLVKRAQSAVKRTLSMVKRAQSVVKRTLSLVKRAHSVIKRTLSLVKRAQSVIKKTPQSGEEDTQIPDYPVAKVGCSCKIPFMSNLSKFPVTSFLHNLSSFLFVLYIF
jgi:hypothetical protein